MQDFQFAGVCFDNSRSTFDPVAAVQVMDAIDEAIGGMMDVTADDAVRLVTAGNVRQCAFEFTDEVDGGLDAALQVIGE